MSKAVVSQGVTRKTLLRENSVVPPEGRRIATSGSAVIPSRAGRATPKADLPLTASIRSRNNLRTRYEVNYAGLSIYRFCDRRAHAVHAASLESHAGSGGAALLWRARFETPALDSFGAARRLGRHPDEVRVRLSVLVGPLRNLGVVCGDPVARHKPERKRKLAASRRGRARQFRLFFRGQ